MASSRRVLSGRGVVFVLLVLTEIVASASIFIPSTSTTSTTTTRTTSMTTDEGTFSTTPTKSSYSTTTSSGVYLPQNLETFTSESSLNIDNKDPRGIQKEISSVHFDSHKFTWLPLEERVAETELEITDSDCEDYLKKFGYLVIDCNGMRRQSRSLCLAPSLKIFQSRMEINITGICDNATKHEMAIPRCDFPDFTTKHTERQKRFNVGKTKWEKSDMPLQIRFDQYNSLMDKRAQEKAMMEAAQRWADVSGLSFTKGTSRNAKIRIGFTNHDGPWGVLGRAWFPKVGKILFEKRENWITELPKNGRDSGKLMFFSVAMHELGHALGISHSNVKNAIMHGQYQRDIMELQSDDIKAVQKLYGKNSTKDKGKKDRNGSDESNSNKNKGSKDNKEQKDSKNNGKGSKNKNNGKNNGKDSKNTKDKSTKENNKSKSGNSNKDNDRKNKQNNREKTRNSRPASNNDRNNRASNKNTRNNRNRNTRNRNNRNRSGSRPSSGSNRNRGSVSNRNSRISPGGGSIANGRVLQG